MNISEYIKQNPTYKDVVVCYLIKNDEVLLGLRKKVSMNLGHNLIAGIGGKLEEGETHLDALKRELKEEINIDVLEFQDVGDVTFLFPHKESWSQKAKVYLCTKWQGEPEETEVIKPIWYKKNNLPLDQMWDDAKYFVPNVLRGEKINTVILYNEDGKVIESTNL